MDWWSAFVIILTGTFVACSCSILGCFLVLRKQAMLGDAISHAILPGIVLAFLFTNSLDAIPMFIGAVIVGIATTFFIQLLNTGGVHNDASMGVTFTTLFALGVVGVATVGEGVHLDLECVLYGEIAYAPLDILLIGGENWGPRSLWVNGSLFLVNLIIISLFYKQYKLCSFDPALAAALGIPVTLFHYLLMSQVAVTVVGAFENVGVILVVAMIVAPAATAYLLTDSLKWMIICSLINGFIAAFFGYVIAYLIDCSIAGAMGSVAGLQFFLAFLLSPTHGLVSQWLARRRMRQQVVEEDILLWAGRNLESEGSFSFAVKDANRASAVPTQHAGAALQRLVNTGQLTQKQGDYQLTDEGQEQFNELIRRHRLYETYLDELGYPTDHVHDPADRVEHSITQKILDKIDKTIRQPKKDPQGKDIPR